MFNLIVCHLHNFPALSKRSIDSSKSGTIIEHFEII